jgi:hypothetical protein
LEHQEWRKNRKAKSMSKCSGLFRVHYAWLKAKITSSEEDLRIHKGNI